MGSSGQMSASEADASASVIVESDASGMTRTEMVQGAIEKWPRAAVQEMPNGTMVKVEGEMMHAWVPRR